MIQEEYTLLLSFLVAVIIVIIVTIIANTYRASLCGRHYSKHSKLNINNDL